MSGVRVLVGTRKGAFILTSDGKRADWVISGPHYAGSNCTTSPGRTLTQTVAMVRNLTACLDN